MFGLHLIYAHTGSNPCVWLIETPALSPRIPRSDQVYRWVVAERTRRKDGDEASCGRSGQLVPPCIAFMGTVRYQYRIKEWTIVLLEMRVIWTRVLLLEFTDQVRTKSTIGGDISVRSGRTGRAKSSFYFKCRATVVLHCFYVLWQWLASRLLRLLPTCCLLFVLRTEGLFCLAIAVQQTPTCLTSPRHPRRTWTCLCRARPTRMSTSSSSIASPAPVPAASVRISGRYVANSQDWLY